jgi:iron(III) transport system permease protein
MEVLNEYGAVKYFGVNTYTIGIFRTWNSMNDTGAAIQLSSILLFIVAFLFIIEKKVNKKKLFSSLKNTKPIELIKSTGIHKLLIYLVCLIPIIFSFIIPVLFNISNAIDNFDKIDLLNLFQLTFNSVSISLISAIIILVVSVYFLFNERFSNSKIYFYLNQFISLGYSIPGAVIALAIIIYFTSIDKNIESISLLGNFYVYLFILIYAYLIRFMAVGKSPIKSGFEKLPKSYDFTAESLGLRRFSIFQKIYLPINKFSFVSALIMVFIDLMKELPIILILRPFNFDTLATQTYEFAIEEMLPLSSIYSLVIIFVCSILLIIFKNIISRINVSRS